MATKRRPLVGTWYAVRYSNGAWLGGTSRDTEFPSASLSRTRAEALSDAADANYRPGMAYKAIPVRCRPLTSKKRNPKRTS